MFYLKKKKLKKETQGFKKKIELLHLWQMRIQYKGDEILNSMFLPIIKKSLI